MPTAPSAGQRFGMLVILGDAPKRGYHPMFLCVCDCGSTKVIRKSRFTEKKAAARRFSCGCKKGGRPVEHGESNTKLYRVWDSMVRRCHSKTHRAFPRYGARGINVCHEWRSYIPFRDWAIANGYKEGLSIERINNDLGYGPVNCCWATRKEQANNRGVCVYYSFQGKTQTLTQWAEQFKMSRHFAIKFLEENGASKRAKHSAAHKAEAL